MAMNWQPIATAPRDGTDIIVMYHHNETQIVHAAFWLDLQDMDSEETEQVGWWSYDKSEAARVMLTGFLTPTHWMPLPEPPEGD
jgi:hypothetical protein